MKILLFEKFGVLFQVSIRNFSVEIFLVEFFGRNLDRLGECSRWMWQKNPFPSTHMLRLIIECSHIRCKTASKFLNVCKHVEAAEKNQDDPLPYPDVLWILSVCKRKSKEKKEWNHCDVFTSYLRLCLKLWSCKKYFEEKAGQSIEYACYRSKRSDKLIIKKDMENHFSGLTLSINLIYLLLKPKLQRFIASFSVYFIKLSAKISTPRQEKLHLWYWPIIFCKIFTVFGFSWRLCHTKLLEKVLTLYLIAILHYQVTFNSISLHIPNGSVIKTV